MNKSVQRTIEILNFFANHSGEEIGISRIAREFEIPKSSASDVLYSLLELGFLQFENKSMKSFCLGNGAIRFGLSALGQFDLLRTSRPELEQLHNQTGFTTLLGVRAGDRVTFAEKFEGGSAIRLADGVGTSKPLHLTSIGKVLLSGYTDEEILGIMGDTCYEVHTRNSIVNPRQLLAAVEKVRKNGYAIENFEENDYVYSIAAPVMDSEGNVCAGICVSMFATDVPQDHLQDLANEVMESARRISSHLGYHPDCSLKGGK